MPEEKKKVIFKPVVVTAKKVQTVGDEDILQINIPYEDDAAILREAAKKEEIKEIKEIKEVKDMTDEDAISRIVDKKISEMDWQKNIRNIGKVSEETKTKTLDIEQKMTDLDTKLGEKLGDIDTRIDSFNKKQEEVCSGTECLKADLSKISKTYESKFGEMDNRFGELKIVLDKLDKRTQTAVCSGAKGCNAEIPKYSSFCPNCGKQIEQWGGASGWLPFYKRK